MGESFITDANRFAQAVLYAADRGVDVIQEPLGTYNDSVFAREAIDYAYDHGDRDDASAADEAAEHHNQPGALPDTIVVNAVEQVRASGLTRHAALLPAARRLHQLRHPHTTSPCRAPRAPRRRPEELRRAG